MWICFTTLKFYSMKKQPIALLAGAVIISGLILGYVFAGDKFLFLYSEISLFQEQPNSPAPQKKSFQGIFAGSWEQIGKISAAATEKISEAIPDISTDGDSVQNQKEMTQPPRKSVPPSAVFSFAVIGDTQNFNIENENGYFQQAVKSIRKLNPDFVVALGDLQGKCSGGKNCRRDYGYWESIMEDLAEKTYAVQGNHDRIGGAKADEAWQKEFDFPKNGPPGFLEIAYSFDFKNSRFVVLASDNPKMHLIDVKQRIWLDQNLAQNKKENIFVFFHEPAFPVYAVSGGSLDGYPKERDALWQILGKYNISAVFNGHEHIVTRRLVDSRIFPEAKNSIYQFVFGNTDSFDHELPQSGVAEYADQGQGRFGFVRVAGKEITVETRGPDGKILDSFKFSK